MPILDRLKSELDRAGKAAQDAFDEGKTRLDAFRERQLADKAAQALGYAVFRAKTSGADLDIETRDRLTATLATHDSEASRIEGDLEHARKQRQERSPEPPSAPPSSSAPPPPPPDPTPAWTPPASPPPPSAASDAYKGSPS